MGLNNYVVRGIKTLSIAFLSLPLLSSAQSNFDIQLKSGQLRTEANAKQYLRQAATMRGDTKSRQVLVQFTTLPTEAEKADLKSKGIELKDYVNAQAYVAFVKPGITEGLADNYSIRSITDVRPEWKAEPAFRKKLAANDNKYTKVNVLFFKGTDALAIRSMAASVGARIEKNDMERLHLYRMEIPCNKVLALAQYAEVRYISLAGEYIDLDMEANMAVNTAIVTAPTSLGGFGLKGDGVVIGVGDNVGGVYHIDLIDRILNFNPAKMTNHGQHINGIVGGAGIIDPKGEGVAPHATLIDHMYSAVLAYTATMRQVNNMTITNNSYATVILDTGFAGTYDAAAFALDELANDYLDVLHVFAAGNDGFQARPPYPTGYGTVCGGFQPAKNNIVVTNSHKRLTIAWDASKGPVVDGRLKPEVTCIGDPMMSTKGINQYLVAAGTSMASPHLAGIAGLLTQRYRQVNGNVNPRADVLKAIVIAGTNDIGNPGPDYCYGFGLANANRSREIIDSARYNTGSVNNNGQQTFNITVPANTGRLKVVLTWHDQPGSLLSGAKQLVNDLDLEVTEPSTTVHYPYVLNPNRPDVLNFAVEARDSLNNTEEVIIMNPVAGTYSVKVKGFNVPVGSQAYAVAYDFEPLGITFKNPIQGTSVKHGDSLCVYWEASEDTNPFTLEFTTNNGGSWTTIDNAIPSSQRHYIWYVPSASSEQCKLRVTRNTTSMQAVSGMFVINEQPVAYFDSSSLCPGYLKVNWSPVPNANAYSVLRKKGFYLVEEAVVNDTTYTFSGLTLDSTYYISVQPLINNSPGFRSLAIWGKPNTGTCPGSISDGDLMVDKIVSPQSGRQLTSTQLGNNETMVVRVRNLDNAASGNFTVHYAVNGVWQSQAATGIPANGFLDVNIPGLNLSATGSYTLQAAVQNTAATDNVSANDSARKVVRNLTNAPVSLVTPVTEGFETFAVLSLQHDTMGLSPDSRWDYANTLIDSGRVRTFINDSFLVTGNRSITMDISQNNGAGTQNYFTATYNFTGLDTATDEVRMDFDYIMHHTKPKFYPGNEVWVRGSDAGNWIVLYHYDTMSVAGQVNSSGTLSVTQALKQNGQNFSSSFQVRFGQNDTSLAAGRDYGNGITFDNLRIYTLQKDMQLLSLLSPMKASCGLTGSLPVTIRLYNSVSQVQANVDVYYKVDNGSVVSESIASIAGYDTLDYTFTQQIASLSPGPHTISVWLSAPGDGLQTNDSLMNISLFNQPLITTFPFLENFEAHDGYWYHNGTNDSWEYGTPAYTLISGAFSGTKAWKTNLDGYYNDLEKSYLYTTCFDISALDSPIVSFKLITDIENCGPILCDAAYMEYSYNGTTWTKLGAWGQGSGWYSDSAFQVWNRQDSVMWRDATLSLPQSTEPIRFRFVFESDQGTKREGLAIDDFRIYEYQDSVVIPADPFEGLVVYPNPNTDGILKIKWTGNVGDKMQVAIIDVAGRVIFREDHIANSTLNLTTLNTGRMMTGVYVVKIIINDRQYFKKVLVH